MRYETDDLHEAAYLVAEGCELLDATEEKRGKVIFTIDGENIPELSSNYFRGFATGNITEFLRCQNKIKNWMFGVMRAREVEEKRIQRRMNHARREELKTA
jgi:hypothetical protein